ncbi:MAG: Spi family protease inhibitor [Bacteroidetes bacterium]|nr:Spi family protease inhibitor [Bacteroidota bacterium]
MKKLLTICLILLAIISYSYAEKVDVKKAMSVAQNFLEQTRTDGNSINLVLAHAYEINIPSAFVPEIIETITLLYIFDIGDENGIIMVSGDDVASPILGYTNSGNFDADILPFSFRKWIEGYKSQIYYAIENNMEAIPSVESLWITIN